MFSEILRKYAFLFVFLPAVPAIWLGCQYMFYLGQTESIGASLAEAGLSSYEVTFFGSLTFAEIFSEVFGKLKIALITLSFDLLKILAFILSLFISLYIGYHPSQRYKIKSFIYEKYSNLKYHYTYNYKTPKPLKFLEYYFFTISFLFLIVIGLGFIINAYNKGEKKIKHNLYSIYVKGDYSYTGVVTEGDKKYRAYKVVCGNYKCIGIDVDNHRNVTFLPEQYKKDFDYKKFKKQFGEK